MAFVSSLCQTKTKGMPECSSQRLCGLVVLSKFVQSSKQKNNPPKKKKKKKRGQNQYGHMFILNKDADDM